MANNQYNFLDYAGLSLFWNNVKSIIEENELATASALTNLDTRVDNLDASKSDKGHTHTSILDVGSSSPITFAYSKAGLSYGDYTYLAGWYGSELRAVNKSQFAQANHTHISLPPERFDSDNPLPNSKNGLTFQFSYNLGSGASGWWNVLNMRSYTDNNYTSSQIITPANNPGTDTGYSGDMKWRQGRNSTWLDWKTILDSNNYTTYCTPANIGAAPSSHTHTKSQITDFAHTHTKSQITDFAHTHTKSQITDFPTSLPASDVYTWAKQSTKPSYTGTEVTLSGYSKNNSYTPIASGDSVQAAIAKLEGAINGLEDLLASI